METFEGLEPQDWMTDLKGEEQRDDRDSWSSWEDGSQCEEMQYWERENRGGGAKMMK